jgi:hypothetical protein
MTSRLLVSSADIDHPLAVGWLGVMGLLAHLSFSRLLGNGRLRGRGLALFGIFSRAAIGGFLLRFIRRKRAPGLK